MSNQLIIAHQLPDSIAGTLRAALPADIIWRGLPPERAYEVGDADILLAVPPRAGNVTIPVARPEGWPHRLRWMQAVSAGVDEFPLWVHEIEQVTCGRGTNSVPIAEYVLAALLAVEKRLDEIWLRDASEWRRLELGTLAGKTLGLLGYGAIGQAVAARAAPFGLRILANRRSGELGESPAGVHFVALDRLLAEADHLVIAVPLTPATAGLVGAGAFAQVKRGVHLVNISRGRVVDHAALLEALERGQVGFATLDVTEPEPLPAGHPLYRHERVHLSPHVSYSGNGRASGIADLFAANLQRFLAGEPLSGIVRADLGY